MIETVEKLIENIKNYGKGSLPKDERYHVSLKNCPCSGIHCSYLEGYDNSILWLFDCKDSIIAEVSYKDIEEITVCKDNFWDVLYTVYSKGE